jgi:hypothetical protein
MKNIKVLMKSLIRINLKINRFLTLILLQLLLEDIKKTLLKEKGHKNYILQPFLFIYN